MSIPWWVMCELIFLISSHTMPAQHSQPTATSLGHAREHENLKTTENSCRHIITFLLYGINLWVQGRKRRKRRKKTNMCMPKSMLLSCTHQLAGLNVVGNKPLWSIVRAQKEGDNLVVVVLLVMCRTTSTQPAAVARGSGGGLRFTDFCGCSVWGVRNLFCWWSLGSWGF